MQQQDPDHSCTLEADNFYRESKGKRSHFYYSLIIGNKVEKVQSERRWETIFSKSKLNFENICTDNIGKNLINV